jgi:hypothetical protein
MCRAAKWVCWVVAAAVTAAAAAVAADIVNEILFLCVYFFVRSCKPGSFLMPFNWRWQQQQTLNFAIIVFGMQNWD